MIDVYYWEAIAGDGKQKESVGHAAMLIGYEDDVSSNTEYVSWWPIGDIWGSPAFKRRTFQDDVQDERRNPTWTYRFFGVLDEKAALDYWTKWKSDVTYRVVTRNCSTCVMSALKAAGITNYVTVLDLDPVVPSDVSRSLLRRVLQTDALPEALHETRHVRPTLLKPHKKRVN